MTLPAKAGSFSGNGNECVDVGLGSHIRAHGRDARSLVELRKPFVQYIGRDDSGTRLQEFLGHRQSYARTCSSNDYHLVIQSHAWTSYIWLSSAWHRAVDDCVSVRRWNLMVPLNLATSGAVKRVQPAAEILREPVVNLVTR